MAFIVQTAEQIEGMLIEVTNLIHQSLPYTSDKGRRYTSDKESVMRAEDIARRYPDIFGGFQMPPLGISNPSLSLKAASEVFAIGKRLREIWKTPDWWERRRLMYDLAAYYKESLKASSTSPARSISPDAFYRVLTYLENNEKRMMYCPNPDCTHPYFLAREKRGTRFCGNECFKHARKQYKQQWYTKKKEGKR